MTTLDQMRARRPGNVEYQAALRADMEREAAAFRLRELRENAGYTQSALAEIIGVGQNRVSQIEHGELGGSRVETLRRYIEAMGAELELTVKRPDGSRVLLEL